MLGLLVLVAAIALVLQLVSTILPGLEMENWGVSATVAIVVAVIYGGADYVWVNYASGRGLVEWHFIAMRCIITTATLKLSSVLLPGLRLKGFFTLLITAVLVTGTDYGLQRYIFPDLNKLIAPFSLQ